MEKGKNNNAISDEPRIFFSKKNKQAICFWYWKVFYFCSPKFSKSKSMYLSAEKKKEIFTKYGKDDQDTGSAEGQIALFTYRIKHLTEHLKQNKKDLFTQRSLVRLVGKRRKLLEYLIEKDVTRYRAIIKELGLRK